MTLIQPSVTSSDHPLPFLSLSPEEFERLCFGLVCHEGYERAEHVGATGSDAGCDIVAFRGNRRVVLQCKRYAEFGPRDAEAAVARIFSLPAEERPSEFILMTSCKVSSAARRRARAKAGSVAIDIWASPELDVKLRRYQGLLSQFFHVPPSAAIDHKQFITVAIRASLLPTLWLRESLSAGFQVISSPRRFVEALDFRDQHQLARAIRFAVFVSLANLLVRLPSHMILGIEADSTTYVLVDTGSTLAIWLVYASVLHFCARIMGGVGPFRETVVGFLYLTVYIPFILVVISPIDLAFRRLLIDQPDLVDMIPLFASAPSVLSGPLLILNAGMGLLLLAYVGVSAGQVLAVIHRVGRLRACATVTVSGLLVAGIALLSETPLFLYLWRAFAP